MNRFIRQPTSIFQLRTPFFAAPPLPLLIRSFSYQPHLSRAVKKKKYLSFVLVIHSTTPSHALRKSLTIKWRPSTPFLTDFDSFPFCCHHSHASLSFIYVHHLFFFFFFLSLFVSSFFLAVSYNLYVSTPNWHLYINHSVTHFLFHCHIPYFQLMLSNIKTATAY